VASARWDEELLADRRAVNPAVDLELDLPVDHHDDYVRLVDVVRPDLARRIDPQPAGEPPRSPAPFDGGLVDEDLAWFTGHFLSLLLARRAPQINH
jgi:hypothetical protein